MIRLSEPFEIRGIRSVILAVTPFQYNPVSRNLRVYRKLTLKVSFPGGNGQFGDTRLRNRWWEPVFQHLFLNYQSLPKVGYQASSLALGQDYEYIIVTPDNPDFVAWADSLKRFRTRQGIRTGVVTLTEIGGNTVADIENYINTAYHTWVIPPVAVLLLADYGTGPATGNEIVAPIYNGYCISDHIYADVTGNQMADVVLSRITARNAFQLETMIKRVFNYERTPPQNPDFYEHPLCVSGWQSTGTSVMYTEVIQGFWEHILGKQPERQYSSYSGVPTSWPGDPYSNFVLTTFGPAGLGYIPATPSYLTNWNGNAAGINAAMNNGAFAVHYRGHGSISGWGEPVYTLNDLSGLNATAPPFVFSLACLTGKFDHGTECFTEAIHRHPHGALGVISPTEVTYSFVTDSYVWGIYNYLWPEFLPGWPSTPAHQRLLPAFANAAGKYFLYSDNWPFNPNSKEVTYHLFHHHGDAFSTLYSSMPMNLTVVHDSTLLSGQNYFTVRADSGAVIALTVQGEIIGVAMATGNPLDIPIAPQSAGDTLVVTVTKQNYLRYSKAVQIIEPTSVSGVDLPSAGNFYLSQNYPNPFNSKTVIPVRLPERSEFRLEIFDLTGARVFTLFEGVKNAGEYHIRWDASRMTSGIYYCWLNGRGLQSGEPLRFMKKMVLIK
ncbi:MAG: hypothetical protein Kow0042_04200 [Calditrichia bacterium]